MEYASDDSSASLAGARAYAFVLGRPFSDASLEMLAGVQRGAIARGLPLAVVASVPVDAADAEFAALAAVESRLAVKNIPVMVLVGSPEKTLAAFIRHIGAELKSPSDSSAAPGALKPHPIPWPGTVQSVAVVRAYARSLAMGEQKLCI